MGLRVVMGVVAALCCLGSAMARMEARVVLSVLAEKMPQMRLVPDQAFRVHPNIQFRGPEELWLTW